MEEINEIIKKLENTELDKEAKEIALISLYKDGIEQAHDILSDAVDIFEDDAPWDYEFVKTLYEIAYKMCNDFDAKKILAVGAKSIKESKELSEDDKLELLKDFEGEGDD